VVYSYTIYAEVVNLLNPRRYTVLNGNFMFDLRPFFRNITGVKRDPPVIEKCLDCVTVHLLVLLKF
jgi:hypothetical protein